MVKISHSINAVMAAQAVRAEIPVVILCKARRMRCMAIQAGLVIHDRKISVYMAGAALHRGGIIMFLVPDQAESSA